MNTNEQLDNKPLGLTSDEVAERVARGEVNVCKEKNGKSYPEIILTNLFTFFNIVWAVIAIILIALGSFSNLTFLFIIIPNVLIAILLECRAKHTVEKLSVTTDPKAVVIRDGEERLILANELVLDDLMVLSMGQQILSDAVVVSGHAEVNESMLTGESRPIKKTAGDSLLAGSFLVGGGVIARVVKVGRDNYVHTIEKAAKSFSAPSSNLRRDMNALLRYIAIFMVPMSVLMYFANLAATGGDSYEAILKTSGSVIGMIPAGVYLLMTVTLTLSVIKLSKKQTLVQDMYSIEMLASADVVCLDKTGTITDGTMYVSDTVPLGDVTLSALERVIAMIEGAEQSLNQTSRALVERFGKDASAEVIDQLPFTSARKYSAVSLKDLGTYSIGAPGFVKCPIADEVQTMIDAFANEGKRVLVIASHQAMEEEGVALGLVAITDRIRPNAKEIIERFQNQDVTVKIISGDHAATVASIAKRVGVKGCERYLSCENISDEELARVAEDYAVFGRVSPEQKVLLVKTLRGKGHTVAMTGDGVNDTLALKESNCAIAMADGSDMACKVSQIVLLNSDFGTLPDVVREGRRCINNVRTSVSLFLMKTILVLLLSVYTVITQTLYPFEPKNMLLIEFFVIGVSSVLLALEPNNKRIEGEFLKTVIFKSIPSGIGLFLPVLTLLILGSFGVFESNDIRNVLAMLSMTAAGYVNLVSMCLPFTKWRAGVVGAMGAGVLLAFPVTYLLNDMLEISLLSGMGGVVFIVVLASITVAAIVQLVSRLVLKKLHQKKAK